MDMKHILLFAIAALVISCSTADKTESVDYTIAHGYFVRNDAPPHAPCRYDTQEAFDSVFGSAATMGAGGMPTQIDFQHKSVIAIIGSETNRPTELIPIALTSKADTLCLQYQEKEQQPSSYRMTPLLLIIVDKPHIKQSIKIEKQ